MLSQEINEKFLPAIEELAPNAQEELAKDTILQNKSRKTKWG
jgi:hypothetical protein